MNWFKENPFLSAIVAVCLVGSGALGYLIFQSATAYTASSEACAAEIAKLHTLQNKVPFPNQENLKVVQAGLEDYTSRINSLRAQLAKMEVPLDETITPQVFQDGLRSAVNDLRSRAEANGVKLPANFYFGFDQYQTQVPTDQAAPFLNRQFRVIQTIVSRLVDFKVASIDGVARMPLPQESPALSAPAADKKKGKDNADEPTFSRFPFDIGFTAEQGKFRVAFNSLLGADQFLIVRSLDLQNSASQAPSKKGVESAASPQSAFSAAAGAPDKNKNSLQVILGRELVKATLRLEMLDFSEPAAPQK